jgi:alpha-D-ribose 1-methylphosphonate 5-triphosphate synthase subunit PhnH
MNGGLDDASMHAGFGAVLMALDDHEGTVLHASAALSHNGTWSFAYHTGIDYRDLHLLLAEAFFAIGDSRYLLALEQVKILDPGNGLNPNNPSSWGGDSSFAAALLHHIQRLEATVGAEMLL